MRQHRFMVSVEQPLFKEISTMAREEGVSLSLIVRDMLKQQVRENMDADLAIAIARDATWDDKKALTHEQFWGLKPKKRGKKCTK